MSAAEADGSSSAAQGPLTAPYPPQTQGNGGIPSTLPDIPVSAVLLLVFICGAATHVTIFKLNKKKNHLFFLSMMTFGFCMCRIVTMVLRIAWSQRQTNVQLALAANVFVQAGTLLLYVINLVFAQRIIRAQHPRLGWHRAGSIIARILIALVVLALIMIITVVTQSSYTLDPETHSIDRTCQLTAVTFYAVVAFLPIPMVIIGLIIPRRIRTEKFGRGRFRHKVSVLIAATLLGSLRAGYGAGVAWSPPTPLAAPTPWYLTKTAFYLFNFLPEICIVYLYAAVRVDRRFHVPNKSRGSYMGSTLSFGLEKQLEQAMPDLQVPPQSSHAVQVGRSLFGTLRRRAQVAGAITFPYLTSLDDGEILHIYDEGELFDDAATLASTLRFSGIHETTLSRDDLTGRWELRRPGSRTTLDQSEIRSRPGSFAMHSSRPSLHLQTSDIGGRESDSICDIYSGERRNSMVIEPASMTPMDPTYLRPSSVHRSRSQFYDIDSPTDAAGHLTPATSVRSWRNSRGHRSSRSSRGSLRMSRGSSILDLQEEGDDPEGFERHEETPPPVPPMPVAHISPLNLHPPTSPLALQPPAPPVPHDNSMTFLSPPDKSDDHKTSEGA